MLKQYPFLKKKSNRAKQLFYTSLSLCGMLSSFSYAQQTTNNSVQIGTDTNSALSLYGPILYTTSTTRAGSISDMLFSATELSAAGLPNGAVITGIAFNKTSAATSNSNSTIEMQILANNSSLTAPLETTTTLGDLTSSHTLVYENSNYTLTSATGWIDYEFDTPFTYTGEGLEFATILKHQAPTAGTNAHFTQFVSWEYTEGYSDYIIGAWPLTSIDDAVILDHNSGGAQFKQRPNIKIYYTTDDANCEAVDTFLETFEDFTAFPENCWSSDKAAPYADIDTHNNSQVFRFYSFFSASDPIYLVSPEVTTIDGNHLLSFDIAGVEANATTTTLQVGTLSDNTDFSTFSPIETAFNPIDGTTHTTIAIPANPGHKYIAIKYTPDNMHQAVFVDNIEWKATTAGTDKFDSNKVKIYPNPTSGIFYIDTEIEVQTIEVYNISGQRIAMTPQKEINLQNAANGVYIVNVIATDGTHATYKVIKK